MAGPQKPKSRRKSAGGPVKSVSNPLGLSLDALRATVASADAPILSDAEAFGPLVDVPVMPATDNAASFSSLAPHQPLLPEEAASYFDPGMLSLDDLDGPVAAPPGVSHGTVADISMRSDSTPAAASEAPTAVAAGVPEEQSMIPKMVDTPSVAAAQPAYVPGLLRISAPGASAGRLAPASASAAAAPTGRAAGKGSKGGRSSKGGRAAAPVERTMNTRLMPAPIPRRRRDSAANAHVAQAASERIAVALQALAAAMKTHCSDNRASLATIAALLTSAESTSGALHSSRTASGSAFIFAIQCLHSIANMSQIEPGSSPVFISGTSLNADAEALWSLLSNTTAAEVATRPSAAEANARNVARNDAQNHRLQAVAAVRASASASHDTSGEDGATAALNTSTASVASNASQPPCTPTRPAGPGPILSSGSAVALALSQQLASASQPSSSQVSQELAANAPPADGQSHLSSQTGTGCAPGVLAVLEAEDWPLRETAKRHAVTFCEYDFSCIDAAPADMAAPLQQTSSGDGTGPGQAALVLAEMCTAAQKVRRLLDDAAPLPGFAPAPPDSGLHCITGLLTGFVSCLAAIGSCPTATAWQNAWSLAFNGAHFAPATSYTYNSAAALSSLEIAGAVTVASSLPALRRAWEHLRGAAAFHSKELRLLHQSSSSASDLPYARSLGCCLSSAVRFHMRRAFNPHIYDASLQVTLALTPGVVLAKRLSIHGCRRRHRPPHLTRRAWLF
jgi:hypothetical protein